MNLAQRIKQDEGNISILTIGMLMIILMAIGMGVAITGVEIDRNRIQFIADGASLHAAATFGEDSIYKTSGSLNRATAKPSMEQVQARVEEFVSRQGKYPRIEAVQIESVEVLDDSSVRVVLVAQVHPPLLQWLTSSALAPVKVRVESVSYAR